MDKELPKSVNTHKNGGIEQRILEAVNEDGLLNDTDKKRLLYLQSLPQNRTEINGPTRYLRQRVQAKEVKEVKQ